MADNIGRDKVASLVSDSSGYFLFHESIENMILRMFRDITNTALKVKVLSATIIICHCTATARMSYLPESRSQINFVHQTNESSYNYLLRKSQRFLSSKRAQNQCPQPHMPVVLSGFSGTRETPWTCKILVQTFSSKEIYYVKIDSDKHGSKTCNVDNRARPSPTITQH